MKFSTPEGKKHLNEKFEKIKIQKLHPDYIRFPQRYLRFFVQRNVPFRVLWTILPAKKMQFNALTT